MKTDNFLPKKQPVRVLDTQFYTVRSLSRNSNKKYLKCSHPHWGKHNWPEIFLHSYLPLSDMCLFPGCLVHLKMAFLINSYCNSFLKVYIWDIKKKTKNKSLTRTETTKDSTLTKEIHKISTFNCVKRILRAHKKNLL